MKHTLTTQEREHLDRRVAGAEKLICAQVVLAVVERSDSYAELPWKAFALGTSVACFLVSMPAVLKPDWIMAGTVLLAVVITLAAGAAAALLAIFVPAFARLFLHRHHAEVEVMEHAKSFFLSRELFNTKQRNAILLLVSLFERQIVILPDTGIGKRLDTGAMHSIIGRMTPFLTSGNAARAFEAGLEGLEQVLAVTAKTRRRKNELPDGIIEEKIR